MPFGEDLSDPFRVYEAVINGRIIYPHFVNPQFPARKLIVSLLSKNPAIRGDPTSLKSHPYFQGFNWGSLLNRKMRAPCKKSRNSARL